MFYWSKMYIISPLMSCLKLEWHSELWVNDSLNYECSVLSSMDIVLSSTRFRKSKQGKPAVSTWMIAFWTLFKSPYCGEDCLGLLGIEGNMYVQWKHVPFIGHVHESASMGAAEPHKEFLGHMFCNIIYTWLDTTGYYRILPVIPN